MGGGAGMRGIGWVGELGSWPSSTVPLYSTRVHFGDPPPSAQTDNMGPEQLLAS